MSKNPFQDMVKINSTRGGDQTVRRVVRPTQNIESRPLVDSMEYDKVDQEGGRKSHYKLWVVAFIAVIFLVFALSFLFTKAHITLKPKSQEISLSENFSAIKDGGAEALAFDLVAISGEETKIVEGQELKDAMEEAKGTVVIYNTFSSASQALDINTRLEGSNGKMYKTDVKIVVPGMKKDGTPGAVEVGIHASDPGDAYNSGPLDFKIFGFKGTSKYSKFYARSKDAIVGGLQGNFYTVSPAEKSQIEAELKDALQAKLLNKATSQIPEGFILFKDAIFLKIDNGISSIASKEKEIPVVIKGTLYGFLLNEKGLTKEIVKNILPNYSENPIHIFNIKDLSFSLANKETISFKDAESIYFKLSGKPMVVWDVDIEKLVTDVLGKKKKDFNQVLLNYPNIVSGNLVLRPIWKMSFPEDPKDIKISVDSF